MRPQGAWHRSERSWDRSGKCYTAAHDPVKAPAPAIHGPTPGSFTCICKAHRDETEEEEDLMNNSPGRQDSCPGAASPRLAVRPSSFASLPQFPHVRDGDVLTYLSGAWGSLRFAEQF